MSAWFAEGGWIDLVLALMAIEGVALLVGRARTAAGPRTSALIANLAAGGLLLSAARLAISGAAAPWVGVVLIAALAAHLYDLADRWRSQ